MYFGYAIFGLIIGIVIAEGGNAFPAGAVGGVLLGLLVAHLRKLDLRVRELESSAQARTPGLQARAAAPAKAEFKPDLKSEPISPAEEPVEIPEEVWSAQDAIDEVRRIVPEPAREPAPESFRARPEPVLTAQSMLESALKKATTWLTMGNIPVKVGVIVSFVGVSFLLKYAVDRRVLVVPLEFRLLAVAGLVA
jgi:uncharacterized membrane protein